MNKICLYDEITPMSIIGCHQCGFKLICSEYEKALRDMYSYIRMGNSAREIIDYAREHLRNIDQYLGDYINNWNYDKLVEEPDREHYF